MAAVMSSQTADRRSEREQAANTLWLLIAHAYVLVESNVAALCADVGITTDDLAEARLRYGRGEDLKPRSRAILELVAQPIAASPDWTPRASGRYGQTVAKRVKEKNPAPGVRRCSLCEELLPVTEFDRKSSKGTSLKSHCRNCNKRYQRDRYLTIERAAAVDLAVAYFTAHEGDACVDMTCPDCATPIAAGQPVTLEAAPRHASCPTVTV